MSIISSISSKMPVIKNTLKTISGKPLAIASKTLAVASLASVLYDSHVNGSEKATVTNQIESADRFYNQFKQYSESQKESATVAKLKKLWFDAQQDFGYFSPISTFKGYTSGFISTFVNNLHIVGLSAVALLTKRVGKLAGILLGINAVKTVVYDVMGIGNNKTTIK